MFAPKPDGTPIIYWVFYFPHIILLMLDSLGRTIKTDKKIYDAVPAEKQEPVFINYINHFL